MKKKNRYIEKAGRGMKYSLSLPERIIRSLAALAALAGGSKVFFERLVGHLRRNGIISGDSKAADFIDVLAAIQEASGNSAVSLDTPPLSHEKLSEMVTEMKTDYGRVFKTTSNIIPRLDALWSNMEQISMRENISLERLCGIITVDAITWSRKGFGLVKATGRTGAELFDEKILESYRKTLQSISGKGVEKDS